MPRCEALRGDGERCLDEDRHYGGHVWPDVSAWVPILRVGDRMTMSLQFAVALNDQEHPLTVRVSDIRTEPDGTKMLYMDRL